MARSAAPQSLGNDSEPSIGDLVAQAIRDVTQLVRCELALAKLELRDDVKRLGLAAALLAITAFTGCLILVLLCWAFALRPGHAGYLDLGRVSHRGRACACCWPRSPSSSWSSRCAG